MVVTIAPENPEVLPLGQQTAYEAGLSLQPHIFYFFNGSASTFQEGCTN